MGVRDNACCTAWGVQPMFMATLMIAMSRLIEAYTNEKATAKLLKYNRIVEEFNNCPEMRSAAGGTTDISGTIREIERERIGYFIKEYILTRLDKIRKNFFADQNNMSDGERVFHARHIEMMDRIGVYADKPSKEAEFVGFIAQRKLKAVKIDDQIVEIFVGDFFVADYEDVAEYVADGSVLLV